MNMKKQKIISSGHKKENTCVVVKVGGELYGFDVMKVKEICSMTDITVLPGRRGSMKGVFCLRGAVIPLFDVRVLFGLDEKEFNSSTVILVVQLDDELIGVLVDAVSDVVTISVDEIQVHSEYNSHVGDHIVEGVIEIDTGLLIIIDVDAVFSRERIEHDGFVKKSPWWESHAFSECRGEEEQKYSVLED